MTDVIWANPTPASKAGPSRNEAFREALRANPGKWAIFRKGAKSSSGLGSYRQSPAWVGFELTARSSSDGVTFYARYVGDGSEK